ncbi:MAG: DUF4136 domain-containing protein [Nitrospirota bacterium]|jgi:hypothetical protein
MRKALLVLWAALLLGGCAGMEYSTRYDPAFDFGRLRTYQFMPIPEDEKGDTLLLLKNMRFAADMALQARGYRPTKLSPDFLVALHATTEKRTEVQRYGYAYSPGFYDQPAYIYDRRFYRHARPYGYYYGPEYYEYRSGVDVYEYRVGTLIVDIVRAETRELIWRGTAQGRLGENFTQRDVQKIVERIMRDFPPPATR